MKLFVLAITLVIQAFAQLSESTSGMVSTAHPLATEAGVSMLRSGGNAFDAAVAVATTLNVVEPQNSGLGGYGLILIYDAAKKQVRVLNASGRIPKGADRQAFDTESNRRGPKTIAPPVNARAWEELSRQYGKKRWDSLFAFAIKKAEQGFALLTPIPEDAFAHFPEHARAVYGRNGKPLAAGETLVQRDLGRSLRKDSVRRRIETLVLPIHFEWQKCHHLCHIEARRKRRRMRTSSRADLPRSTHML